MTYLGKFLVLVNGAISLTFCFWAVSLYVHPTGWVDQTKDLGVKIQTELANRNQAQDLYVDATNGLVELLDKRSKNDAVYRETLVAMDTGLDAKGQPAAEPVRTLKYEKGDLSVDPKTFLPLFGPGPAGPGMKPLEALDVYIKDIEKSRATLADKRAAVTALVDQDHKLAATISQARDQLAEAQRRLHNAADEEKYLQPFVYNHQVERQLLEDRKAQLEARKKELETAGHRSARQ